MVLMNFSLVYIAGAGRSGSTLLDLLLGNQPDTFSIGEARYFWEYWTKGDRLCGCGRVLTDCPFWKNVHARIAHKVVDIERVAQLANRFDRTRNLAAIGLIKGRYFPRELVSATRDLYEAIATESRSSLIVDSSKVPSHLELLRAADLLDIRVIHLIRDSRAVAHSWSKRRKIELGSTDPAEEMPAKSPLKASLVWAVENVFADYFSRRYLHSTRLNYEALVDTPDETLTNTFSSLGLQSGSFSRFSQREVAIQATHSVGGNPIRFQSERITIRHDDSWRRGMSRWRQISLGIPVFILLRRYGYRL